RGGAGTGTPTPCDGLTVCSRRATATPCEGLTVASTNRPATELAGDHFGSPSRNTMSPGFSRPSRARGCSWGSGSGPNFFLSWMTNQLAVALRGDGETGRSAPQARHFVGPFVSGAI